MIGNLVERVYECNFVLFLFGERLSSGSLVCMRNGLLLQQEGLRGRPVSWTKCEFGLKWRWDCYKQNVEGSQVEITVRIESRQNVYQVSNEQ